MIRSISYFGVKTEILIYVIKERVNLVTNLVSFAGFFYEPTVGEILAGGAVEKHCIGNACPSLPRGLGDARAPEGDGGEEGDAIFAIDGIRACSNPAVDLELFEDGLLL